MTRIELDGERFTVVNLLPPVLIRGTAAVRAVMVADTVEELTTPEAYEAACTVLLESVKRRGLKPTGLWCVGTLPIDFPGWESHLEPAVAAKATAARDEMDGHVALYVLLDSSTLEDDPAK